jgi:hypothetical protein
MERHWSVISGSSGCGQPTWIGAVLDLDRSRRINARSPHATATFDIKPVLDRYRKARVV